MWDVKVLKYSSYEQLKAFYLNYVGCKDNVLNVYDIGISRFTLTMWDVKSITLVYVYPDYVFYLNYVGCKDNINSGIRFKIKSFTLTMWDVKLYFQMIYPSVYFVLP